MNYYTTYLKNEKGENFLGLRIDESEIKIWLDKLKDFIGTVDFDIFTQNQKIRDNSKYYLTIISPSDYSECIENFGMDNFLNELDKRVFQFEVDDLEFRGIGTCTDGPNRSFFVVCKSDGISAIRTRFELPEIDLHITLGFDKKDVIGVRKNQLLKKGPKFLKLLEMEYYKNENWDFIKKIGNYTLDKTLELQPVELTDTTLTLKCGSHYIQIIYLEDGEKFWIGTCRAIDIEKTQLSDTEIIQIFNKNTTYGTL